jgi:hypothetical protein
VAPVVNSKSAMPVISLPAVAAPGDGPLTFEAAAPDGHWLVTCQARSDSDGDGQIRVGVGAQGELSGDALSRYLGFASGVEEPIDDLLASSPDGRWLVLEKDGQSELLDTSDGARLDLTALGADTRREPQRWQSHRTLVFDTDSLFYVRGAAKAVEVVERRLSSGAERVYYRTSEPVLGISLDAAGKALILVSAGADANGNGRFDWPYQLEQGKRPCRGPLTRYRAARANADPTGFVVIDRASAEAHRADQLAAVFGSEVVLRAADGALVAERGKQRRALADSACAGRILWLDPGRDQLLVGCAMPKKTGRLAVELVAAGRHTPLEIDVAALGFDEIARPAERLAALYPGADTVLFDAEKRLLHRLKSGDAVLAISGAHALVRRGRTLLLFDAEVGSEALLAGKLDALGDVLKNGSLVFASPFVVDVADGRVLGTITGRPLSLASSGAALVPAQPASAESLALGPLTWQTPKSEVSISSIR